MTKDKLLAANSLANQIAQYEGFIASLELGKARNIAIEAASIIHNLNDYLFEFERDEVVDLVHDFAVARVTKLQKEFKAL